MACRCVSRLASIAVGSSSTPSSSVLFANAIPPHVYAIRESHGRYNFKKFGQKLNENAQKNPRNMEEVEKMGLSAYLKKNRMYAQYNYQEWRYPQKERAIDISCTRFVFHDYDDKQDRIVNRLKEPRKVLTEKRTEFFSNRIIKRRIPSFHRKRFPIEAQEIYVKAHDLLNTENWTLKKKQDTEEALHGLVTEYAYPGMLKGLEVKTVNWKFVESIEPPRVVHIACAPMVTEENLYAQVIVRFYTKQLLTIHDRFGRLMLGSRDEPRDVLEYVTFERHLVDLYGKWRIHSKKLAENQHVEELEKTIAVIKRKPERSRADEWHKQEKEECAYKWYPAREFVKFRQERLKRKARGQKYWRRSRKRHVLTVKRTPKTRMKRKYLKKVWRKTSTVLEMRQRGELPLPPE